MKYDDIRKMPTVRNNEHESLFRAFHILAKVKELLRQGTAPGIVLELIQDLEKSPEEDGAPGEGTPITLNQAIKDAIQRGLPVDYKHVPKDLK